MNKELFDAIDGLEKAYGISPEYMYTKVEEAIVKACIKEYGGKNLAGQNSEPVVKVNIDPVKKDIKCYISKAVVAEVDDPVTQITVEEAKTYNKRMAVGKVLDIEVKTKNLRRISAGTAKSVIIQAIREGQKETSRREFENKQEEIITATVAKIHEDTGDIEVETGNGLLKLPVGEQIPGETYEIGQKIMIYFCKVDRRSGDSDIRISRSAAGLVKCLFKRDIPEIADGTIVIRNIAREAGSRTKISVLSADESVDAVGSCIGQHGTRIAGILAELGKEKIDVIAYNDDKAEYIKSALSPASVISVDMLEERTAHVVVAPEQLSLAIGVQGQNARLAAKLTGCKVDIKTE
ncbi:MAG: transcription termination factor NusA [Clostridia bacterium]|nr:transcription termination factor NusA [Clostridia bacterium]